MAGKSKKFFSNIMQIEISHEKKLKLEMVRYHRKELKKEEIKRQQRSWAPS